MYGTLPGVSLAPRLAISSILLIFILPIISRQTSFRKTARYSSELSLISGSACVLPDFLSSTYLHPKYRGLASIRSTRHGTLLAKPLSSGTAHLSSKLLFNYTSTLTTLDRTTHEVPPVHFKHVRQQSYQSFFANILLFHHISSRPRTKHRSKYVFRWHSSHPVLDNVLPCLQPCSLMSIISLLCRLEDCFSP